MGYCCFRMWCMPQSHLVLRRHVAFRPKAFKKLKRLIIDHSQRNITLQSTSNEFSSQTNRTIAFLTVQVLCF